jgi:hypothetical protein
MVTTISMTAVSGSMTRLKLSSNPPMDSQLKAGVASWCVPP